jgi:TrmH family RNA methyltransferase
MTTLKSITSRQNPVVSRFRAAARGDGFDLILLDGAHLVAAALDAGVPLQQAVVAADAVREQEIGHLVERLERLGVDLVAGSPVVMKAVSPVRSPSPVVALAARPIEGPARVYRETSALVIIAVDVQDPGNVGAIVRVAEAGGASGVVAAGACADPFGWKALRGSMGSAVRLPIAVSHDPAAAVRDARRHGCRIVAAVPRTGQSLFGIDLTGPIAVLFGAEGAGLPSTLVDDADERVTIPMQPPVESLNAAVTAALVVYEARRQRG